LFFGVGFMLIDWLTLRHPITDELGLELHKRIMENMGHIVKFKKDGSIDWEKAAPDWESIRSDATGIYWSITADGEGVRYLTIGASPSSISNAGVNVFGTLALESNAQTLIKEAGYQLGAILPNWRAWQCRRMDITANYDMGSPAQVKQALRLLLGTDAPRRRTNSDRKGGDSVYWNPSSTLRAGKAYHKGAHLRYQLKKGNIQLDEESLTLADNLLRLELMLGSMWFRRLDGDGIDWHELTETKLAALHENFFQSLIGGGDSIKVNDMGTLLNELEKVAPSKGYALAAHRTWALIKTLGYTQTQESMPRATFARHCKILRDAGLSSADLCGGVVIPFRQKCLILNAPVTSWEQLRKVA
jgi:II/X family phage/plasmid replication protein